MVFRIWPFHSETLSRFDFELTRARSVDRARHDFRRLGHVNVTDAKAEIAIV